MVTTPEASYTAGEAFDRYGATVVPLRTPLGPVTLTFTDGEHCTAVSGYIASEYGRGQAHLNDDGEAFTWKGAEVVGLEHFYADQDWMPRTGGEYGPAQIFSRRTPGTIAGAHMTTRQSADITRYWSAIITAYVTDHPATLAHATFRAAVLAMGRKEQEIRDAGYVLAGLRKERAALRAVVRRTFTDGHHAYDIRPYADMDSSYASGYVIELEQEAMRPADR